VTDSAAAGHATIDRSDAAWDSMLAMADDELISAHALAHLCDLAGPALEPMLAVLSYVQDDTGHSIRWYELVQSHFGLSADDFAYARTPDNFRCSALTEIESTDWYVVVAKNMLYKTADVARQKAIADLGDHEIAQLVARTLDEDRFHESFWRLWAQQLLDWDPERFRRTCFSVAADARSLFELDGFWSDADGSRLFAEWGADVADLIGVDKKTLLGPLPQHRARGRHRPEFVGMIDAMQSVYRAFPGGVW
jgi:phenylacetate-CoA oxygenase PaaI subunit